MLIHNVFCVCFLVILAPKIETNSQLYSEAEKPEALFADVIKNISRVNNELQDLINNYEQFKKMQNSLENFDDKEAHVSDTEGGHLNRNNKNSVDIKRDPSGKTSTTLKFPTEMIFNEDEAEKSIETGTSSKSQHSNEVEKSHEVESRQSIETTGKIKHSVQKTTTEASIANEEPISPKEETEPESQELLDIDKKMKIKKKRTIPEAAVEQAQKKTKYFEKYTLTKYLDINSSDSYIEDERHREEEEVDVSKPKERAYEKNTDPTQFTVGIYLRSHTDKSRTTKKVENDVSLELTDDDEALSKDLFKTSVLRQAYGDACLKLVIRKCYRACKSAYKSSCQLAVKCKSELKKYFDRSARTGCIEAFNASSKEDNSDNFRRIVGPKELNGGVMTREGFLSMACQTQIEKQPTRRMAKNTTNQNGEQLNILRDQYERACQQISQSKCGKACAYAHNATCNKYKCSKRLKKNFKRHCRTDCKIAFSNRVKKSSDSDDDSDDDSDNDSSTGSDSDDDDDET